VCVLCFDWFCHHFGSSAHSFAPQQISSFLGASAEIQEQHDLLYQGLKSLILLLCKTRPARTCPRRTALLQQAHGKTPPSQAPWTHISIFWLTMMTCPLIPQTLNLNKVRPPTQHLQHHHAQQHTTGNLLPITSLDGLLPHAQICRQILGKLT